MKVKELIKALQERCERIPGTEDLEAVIYATVHGDIEQVVVDSIGRTKCFYSDSTVLQLYSLNEGTPQ